MAGTAPGAERKETMATIEELVKQYETDPDLRKEVDGILADNRITLAEFMSFVRNHDVDVSVSDFPKIIKEAKEAGLLK